MEVDRSLVDGCVSAAPASTDPSTSPDSESIRTKLSAEAERSATLAAG